MRVEVLGRGRARLATMLLLAACGDGGGGDGQPGQPSQPASDAGKTDSPGCGDGHIDPGEACDDGELNANYRSCTGSCAVARCGDGLLGPDETCDDGNAVAG